MGIETLVDRILYICNTANDKESLLKWIQEELKNETGVEEIILKDVNEKNMSNSDSYVLNTKKILIDNKMSDYSLVPEFIEAYKKGYKSGAIVPIVSDEEKILIYLYSSKEEIFNEALRDALTIISIIVSKDLSNKELYIKLNRLAKYFDIAFNNNNIKAILDENGKAIIKNDMAKNLDISNLLEKSNVIINNKIYNIEKKSIDEKYTYIEMSDISDKIIKEGIESLINKIGFYLVIINDGKISYIDKNLINNINIDKDEVIGKNFDLFFRINGNNELILPLDNNIYSYEKVSLNQGLEIYILYKDLKKDLDALNNTLIEIIKNSNDIIIKTNKDGFIKEVNESFIKEISNDIPISSNIISILNPQEDVNKLFNSNNEVNLKIFSKVKNSDINVTCRKITLGDDILIICKNNYYKDAVELLNKEIIKKEREVERFKNESDLKTQFIYNISHDLKTPLTNIKGFSTLLLNEEFGNLNEEQKSYIKIIIDESERLMQLITQILDVAKLSSGKIKLDLQKVNFQDIKNNPSIKALEEMATKKGLFFVFNIDYDVPEIIADPNRLIQIFVNLISNAIKFTDKGGITIHISKKNKNVKVEVIDTGIGISKEDKAKLFKRFYQVNKTRNEKTGTGLGLSIVKGLVNLHGGRIGVNSEPGKGSNFYFIIPINGPKSKKKVKE